MHAIAAYVYLLVCLLFHKIPGTFNLGNLVGSSSKLKVKVEFSLSLCTPQQPTFIYWFVFYFIKFQVFCNLGTIVGRSQYSVSRCGLSTPIIKSRISNIAMLPSLKNELHYVHKDPLFSVSAQVKNAFVGRFRPMNCPSKTPYFRVSSLLFCHGPF